VTVFIKFSYVLACRACIPVRTWCGTRRASEWDRSNPDGETPINR